MAKQLLVVDDDPSLLLAVSDTLRAEGYEVQTARRGSEAMIRVAESLPDLIISDIRMPGMDGYALVRNLRASPRSITAAPLDVADTILPTLLTHIARVAPRVKLEIRVDRSPFLMDALRAGEQSVLEYSGMKLRDLPDKIFTKDYLKRLE